MTNDLDLILDKIDNNDIQVICINMTMKIMIDIEEVK